MLNQTSGLEFNSEGYMVNFDAWNMDIAMELAEENGLVLTECHWFIIDFLRDYQSEYGIAPDPRVIIKSLSKKINPTSPCTKQHLEGMFGQGGCKLACKIAGLPNGHCKGV